MRLFERGRELQQEWDAMAPEVFYTMPTHLSRQAVLLLEDFIDEIEDAEERHYGVRAAAAVTRAAAGGGAGAAPAQTAGDARVTVTITVEAAAETSQDADESASSAIDDP